MVNSMIRREILLSCTDDERRSCLPTVEKLLDYAVLARKEGVLAMESAAEGEETALRVGLELICDGHDPEHVEDVMWNFVIAARGVRALDRMIVADGVLLIQKGDIGLTIMYRLLSMLGEAVLQEHEERLIEIVLPKSRQADKCLASTDWPPGPLDKLLIEASDTDIQQLLMSSLGNHGFARVMINLTAPARERILANVGKRTGAQLINLMSRIHPQDEANEKAVQELLEAFGRRDGLSSELMAT